MVEQGKPKYIADIPAHDAFALVRAKSRSLSRARSHCFLALFRDDNSRGAGAARL